MPLSSCEQMPEHHPSMQAEHDAQALLKQCPTNATNELTKIFSLLGNQSHVSNARRGAARFIQLWDENSRPAAASRQAVTHA